MFQIGDKIVYPMHGAGVIEAIEEKEIQGEKRQYYVVKIPISNMKVMIPTDNAIESGLRRVADKSTMEKVLHLFTKERSDDSLSWKQRYNLNMEKMKLGALQEGAEVVRDLMLRNKEKALNTSEKQMLDNAQRILVSELVLIKNISENEALHLLNEHINVCS